MTTPSSPKRVLFVCLENTHRSQMAQAFARIHGGPTIEAYSADSRPSSQINPKAAEAMCELGYDLGTHASKSLAGIPDVEYNVVVTMGCGDACPFVRTTRREGWNIPDPKEFSPEPFRQVRNVIEAKVKELLASLWIQPGVV